MTSGQVLTSDGTGNIVWSAGNSGGSTVTAIDHLTDVTISSPSSGQVLYYNGSNWTNGVTSSYGCLLYTSPSPRDVEESRMPSSA